MGNSYDLFGSERAPIDHQSVHGPDGTLSGMRNPFRFRRVGTNMNKLRDLLDEPGTSFAIVGATDTPGKYGGRIYRDLKRKGYPVFAVNPRAETVDGDPAYSSLTALPEVPTMAVMVVPAPVGVKVIDDAAEAGIENIWVQPGALSKELGEKLDAEGFSWIGNGPCVMVETR